VALRQLQFSVGNIRATRASNFSRPDLILGDLAKIESDFAVLGMNLDCAGSQSFDKRK
jgi:hypothetical protein